jgi:hypothetical protein
MAETLGSLCDKLTIVKLKQFHSEDSYRLSSLATQEKQLCEEIDWFIRDAVTGEIPSERLVSELARVNCELWHEQEKVYDFEKVAPDEKNVVVKQLAILNLQRNQCIDKIDKKFQQIIEGTH